MRTFRRFLAQIPAQVLVLFWLHNAIAADNDSVCEDANGRPATAVVAAAEAAAALAFERGALWTVAVDALGSAKKSLRAGACDQAIRDAEAAIAFCRLGINQLQYPPYQIP